MHNVHKTASKRRPGNPRPSSALRKYNLVREISPSLVLVSSLQNYLRPSLARMNLLALWVGSRVQWMWLLYFVTRSQLNVFAFSLHAAFGLVKTMELVYHSTRRTAMCAFARENSQGNFAKQGRKVFTPITLSKYK